uniref:Uncharacterized protein n=1 Tax=Amphilophus citrinellus TaxID=61819 RepID=A0A3Q0RCJ2_AMPCI
MGKAKAPASSEKQNLLNRNLQQWRLRKRLLQRGHPKQRRPNLLRMGAPRLRSPRLKPLKPN